VIVREIGTRPLNDLKRSGKYVHIACGSVKDAVDDAVKAYRGLKF
jgi:predicted Fe-Mo cluster-binding NifX family protein